MLHHDHFTGSAATINDGVQRPTTAPVGGGRTTKTVDAEAMAKPSTAGAPITRRRVDQDNLDQLAARLHSRSVSRYERLLKPLMDRVLAAALVVVLGPVLLTVALAVLIVMGRPVLLGQTRMGRHNIPFAMLKFRTMLPDRRVADPADAYDGPDRRVIHKTPDDPRHTTLGRWMRKLSFDELPQLFNVITGQMTLVGPRPEIIGMTANYTPWQRTRHLVKPGVTGLWQTTERGKGLLLHECIDLDLKYIERLSFREDMRILLRTPAALLRNRGVV